MSPAEERDYLEQVLAGKAQPTLSPAGTLGRLAQLHLEAPAGPQSPARALYLVQVGLEMEGRGSPLYPKFRHFQATALRALPHPPPEALGIHGTAAEADREAGNLSLKANPRDALEFARSWGDWAWAHDLFDEAGEAYSSAHQAQGKLLLNETEGEAARMKMQSNTRFATQGAYALFKAGQAQKAILLLEQTSLSVLNAARQRSELVRLEQIAPELKARLLAAMGSAIEIHQSKGLDAFGGLSPEEKEAQAKTNAIVAEIRQVAGFEAFAKGVGWDDVAEASTQFPLVYLVPTSKGTVALSVSPGAGSPGSETSRTVAAVNIPVSAMEIQAAFRAFAGAEYGSEGDRRVALNTLLGWLGSHVMIYVKTLLIKISPREGPFSLIPFGFLASLPVHLGIIQVDETRRQALFHPRNVTFAYSAAGLAASQRKSRRANAVTHALVISNPHPIPPEYDELLLSDFEARMVSSRLPCDVLAGRDADTQNVLQRLPAATLAHFSCHGVVDSRYGYTGVLLLANKESLNYEHLRMLPELAARLVVLSACSAGTAALDVEHGVSLPNAFLAAGTAAVLGTFWHTDELACLLLLQRFYELWLDPRAPCTPVQALGDAQEWLMTTTAQTFRAALQPDVLESPASAALKQAGADDRIYADPWYWGEFFLAGA